MKTILHIIDTTGPGGAETVFIQLATGLPSYRYRSVVSIKGKGWVNDELVKRGVRPVMLDPKGSFNWRYLFALVRLIRKEHVDLIHSHLLGSNVYGALAGLITGTPVIATFHGEVDIGENERFKILKFLIIKAGASSIVAVTDSLREDISERTALGRSNIDVIYNGIDTRLFQKSPDNTLRDRFGWGTEDIIVGSLGNIRPAKGYDILLRAASLLNSEESRYRFVIAGQGEGELFDELMDLQKALGLEDRVKFMGFIDDAGGFLSNLDIFLSSSVSEGLPLSAIQAMVSRLPIVATRCGGYEGLINHMENGWLVDVGDPNALAQAIDTVAPNRELRDKLGGNAYKRANETFDIHIMFDNYLKLYERIIHSGS